MNDGTACARRGAIGLALIAAFATPLAAADPSAATNATEWVVVLATNFQNSDIKIDFKTIDYARIRAAVREAVGNGGTNGRVRMTLAPVGFVSPECDHSQTEIGLRVAPAGAVALDAGDRPDGIERFYDRGGAITRTVPWKNGQRNGEEIACENGRVTMRTPWVGDRIQGLRQTFHANGKVMSEAAYANGLMNGPSRVYDDQGRPLQEVEMKDGQRNGEARDYWPGTGKLKRTVRYDKGKVTGVSREFFADGAVKRELPFKDNAMHGAEVLYGPDGKPSGKRYWLDGEEVSEAEFKARGGN